MFFAPQPVPPWGKGVEFSSAQCFLDVSQSGSGLGEGTAPTTLRQLQPGSPIGSGASAQDRDRHEPSAAAPGAGREEHTKPIKGSEGFQESHRAPAGSASLQSCAGASIPKISHADWVPALRKSMFKLEKQTNRTIIALSRKQPHPFLSLSLYTAFGASFLLSPRMNSQAVS